MVLAFSVPGCSRAVHWSSSCSVLPQSIFENQEEFGYFLHRVFALSLTLRSSSIQYDLQEFVLDLLGLLSSQAFGQLIDRKDQLLRLLCNTWTWKGFCAFCQVFVCLPRGKCHSGRRVLWDRYNPTVVQCNSNSRGWHRALAVPGCIGHQLSPSSDKLHSLALDKGGGPSAFFGFVPFCCSIGTDTLTDVKHHQINEMTRVKLFPGYCLHFIGSSFTCFFCFCVVWMETFVFKLNSSIWKKNQTFFSTVNTCSTLVWVCNWVRCAAIEDSSWEMCWICWVVQCNLDMHQTPYMGPFPLYFLHKTCSSKPLFVPTK